MRNFPFFKQLDLMDCGPACLKIISKYYGKNFSMKYFRDKCNITREGVSLLDISRAAEDVGLRTLSIKITFEDLLLKIPLPCIVHWNYSHFVVVYKIKKNKVYVSDPQIGLVTYTKDDFCRSWKRNNERGMVTILEASPKLYETKDVLTSKSISYYFNYIKNYKGLLGQVLFGMIFGILLSLLFPMISQAIVDIGIGTRDIHFINVLLVAGIILTFSSLLSNVIQSRIMLYVANRINISMVSDFIKKVLKLPIPFFERKMVADILLRIDDHNRVQTFVFDVFLKIAVSGLSFIVYSILMMHYNMDLFLIFLAGTAFYVAWICLFLSRRRKLDFLHFDAAVVNQGEVLGLIDGINEVKINNLQQRKRWKWEESRLDIYNLNLKQLNLMLIQGAGSTTISSITNLFLTITAAKAVISGEMTIGMMLSLQYILGQLSGPVGQLIGIIQSSQDAKISLERINEVIFEEKEEKDFVGIRLPLPEDRSIELKNVSFKYSPNGVNVLKNINLLIPRGKLTAIVGESGSGKSSLMKLLLRFYEPTEGAIVLGDTDYTHIDIGEWRENCGTVLQDGKLFSGTILENIALKEDDVDLEKLHYAIKSANLEKFISGQPLKHYAYIGQGGVGVSGGEKQRILIARALYKDPAFLFLDEPTNALDSNNEKEISENIIQFTKGRTTIIIAHRLSTIMAADQIIVLDKGAVVELGTHEILYNNKQNYHNLIKNQMFVQY